MSRARMITPEERAAAARKKGSGSFSAYMLPPLAVIVVGVLLALFAFTMTPRDLHVLAAAATPIHAPLLATAVDAALPKPTPGTSGVIAQAHQIPGPPDAPQAQAFIELAFPNLALEAAPSGSKQISRIFTPEVQ